MTILGTAERTDKFCRVAFPVAFFVSNVIFWSWLSFNQTQLPITLPDDFCLCTHATYNTFTMATTHFPTAETLKTLTSLEIGDQTYPCTAYVAPPPGVTRGVITNAYDDETPTQLYQDLVRRNPEYTILAARRMGKTHSILITFDANAVPHSIKYMGAIHRCTLYRGSPDACTNCRQPGHRQDHSQQDPPCTPKCILCEGPSPYRHGIVQGATPSLATGIAKPPRNAAVGIGPTQGQFSPIVIRTHPAQPTQASLDRAIEASLGHAPLFS
ncbi:hypothetical protein HPB49_001863 [Dermacentor silvarum]|uniref:Uncharacterized protein n=1 Tax=Dermacentor silvarum TaxID=543639 RepID=A0ACB8D9R6_DERSI|nr:hypothetical protein HPB49_001863 [Dermacentor silvarum]